MGGWNGASRSFSANSRSRRCCWRPGCAAQRANDARSDHGGRHQDDEKTIDALAAVSSVRQEQIDQILPKRTSDLFFGMPGVWFHERGDKPETAINIRGLQDFGRVAVVIDGARQNFQRSGHNANGEFFLEPELVGGVDVVRGRSPTSTAPARSAASCRSAPRTRGRSAPGREVGRARERQDRLEHGAGSARFFGAARPTDNVDFIAGGTYRAHRRLQGRPRRRRAEHRLDVATGIGKLTFRPAEGHEIKLGAHHARITAIAPARTRRTRVGLRDQCGAQHRDRPLSLQPARRPALQFRRQRLLDHDSAGSAQGPERHAGQPAAIRSPASSATSATSRSTPRASTSTTPRASTSATSAMPSPTAATTSTTR